MPELLPNGDKVEAVLDDGEEVTVPSGKVWVVDIITISNATVEIEPQGEVSPYGYLSGDDSQVDSTAEMTLHENTTVVSVSRSFVTGWEFDYSV